MNEIEIIPIDDTQVAKLQTISKQTFQETFAPVNTAENMTRYLEENFTTEKMLKELVNPECLFFFAVKSNEVIGYLKLNIGATQTELQESNTLEIERIYVQQVFHGKKVGQVLYEKAISTAKELNVDYVWLGVWEENKRAINFYTKNGFVPFDKHYFKLGDDVQTDIMMRLILK